jgi:hypothetical protein
MNTATHATQVEKRLLNLSDYQIIAPARLNPTASQVETIVENLCRDLNIHLPYYGDYTTMPAYLYPETSVERLVPVHLLLNMLWYVDDVYDRDRVQERASDKAARETMYQNCIDILRTGDMPAEHHLLYPVFCELHYRFRSLSDEAWLDRLTDAMMEHLKASMDTREAIVIGETTDVARYMHVREFDSGMRPTIYMVEFVKNIFLPDEIMNHPYLKAMTLRCARIGSLTNDIFSYEKEVIKLDSDYNLIRVFMESEYLSFDEAVHESIMLLNGIIDDFLHDAANMPEWDDPSIQAMVCDYIDGLRDIIVATWHWQYSTNRYRSSTSPFVELRTML